MDHIDIPHIHQYISTASMPAPVVLLRNPTNVNTLSMIGINSSLYTTFNIDTISVGVTPPLHYAFSLLLKYYSIHGVSFSDLQNIMTGGCQAIWRRLLCKVIYKIVLFYFCLADGSSNKTSSRNQVPDY